MIKHKLIPLLTAAAISFSIPAFAQNYNDVPENHWAYTYIENATENGIFEGYEDGSFKPEKQLTHEELTKVIISLMKDKLNDIPSDNLNDDIPNRDYWTNRWDNWSQPYLNIALNSEMLNTNDTAYAYKNMLVSREDMSKIVARAIEYMGSEHIDNTDEYTNKISDWNNVCGLCKPYVAQVYAKGIITGYEDGTFRGTNYVTRAELSVIVEKLSKNKI